MIKTMKRTKKALQMTASEAVSHISDNSTIAILGAGGGICEPTTIINALSDIYEQTNHPASLTFYHTSGLGNRGERGMSPLAKKGMVKRVIGGHWGQSPKLAEMAESNEIEAYNFPQGVTSQLLRATAAGQPGIITKTGIGTFIDPRQKGGCLNNRTKNELIKLIEINEEEFLFFPSIPIDVAIIRGTTSDTEGYISMEDEIAYLDALSMAQAAHNNGGLVIAQVKRIVKSGTIHPKDIKIPGYLIDILVEEPSQEQLYNISTNRFISNDYVQRNLSSDSLPLNERKLIARRAFMELSPGDVGNVGIGICDGIGKVAQEEGVSDSFTLTVESGPIGGTTAQGMYFGATFNMRALIDMPSQFDFYDGGGLDICFLSFAQVDKNGNINVHKFNHRIMGTGGFIDISQFTKKVIFCGTFTAGGLKIEISDGNIHILKEGKFKKFINEVDEITFSGKEAQLANKEVTYITERAVFCLTDKGLLLTEIAPGIDLEKDVLAQMTFKPLVSPDLKKMNSALFLQTSGVLGEIFQKKIH